MRPIYLLILVAGLLACKKQSGTEDQMVVSSTDTVHVDMSYATTSAAQKLDLYLPASGNRFPLVIWIHGGGWQSGDKAPFVNTRMFKALKSNGYAVASLNYRLSGEAKFPAQIQDVKAAVRWLKAHAAYYKLDSTRFGAWGSSAGGHLTALLATSGSVAALEDLSMGNASNSSRIQVAIDWFGPANLLLMQEMVQSHGCTTSNNSPNSPESKLMGFPIQDYPDRTLAACPVSYASSDDPPMYIQHGKLDCTVSYLQSELLYNTLLQVKSSDDIKLSLFEQSGHGGNEFETDSNINRMIDFLDLYLK